jgi:NitT/TauT family transport system permease protein
MSPTSSPETTAGQNFARVRPVLNIEGAMVFATIIIAWQIAARLFPPFLFPSLGSIATAIADIFRDPATMSAIGLTYVRILISLTAAFALSLVLGIWAGFQVRVGRALLPLVQFLQGVPAVCWIIFAVLWFHDTELRIAFVILISTFPSFYYQIREGLLAIPDDLSGMVRALRPTRWQLVRKLILPSLVPQLLTGWRLNLGAGTKVTIMAELLGGISGIGYQLRLAQELFRMDRAIAWTAVLVFFVLATNKALALSEKRLLAWRIR